ncbi:hypothetical protein EPA93_38030 [Ktedonosporobacter rubrisoli]|uniref:DUF998 domain-containing protein n=1 Tax=Ktedonosporobacter rubrisoli TaxID=2509675 RepID=A0A4P6K0X8_KTERU|nr:hypothetical protein [Ktedonosporobacter rubrisoli]QBD81462.1 hypothetical protein EPA93_38030 [Ktedonosporobacter rubrisoli]
MKENTLPPSDRRRWPIWRAITPAAGLFLLAPLIAEYLFGNISIADPFSLPFLAPMYGGGALLIREITRRTKRGWPTIILLGAAYAVVEEGLIDQALFSSNYFGQDFQSLLPIPGLGISAYYALTFLVIHTIWSISIPIALVEALVPSRRTTPWLGNIGLCIVGIVFLLGSTINFLNQLQTQHFLASTPQMLGTIAFILAAIGAAFIVGRRPRPRIDLPILTSWQTGIVAFVASSAFFLLLQIEHWLIIIAGIALFASTMALIAWWSRSKDWGSSHQVALAAGALLTYAWVGFTQTPLINSADMLKFIGNIVFAAGAVLLALIAFSKTRRAALEPGTSNS